MAEGTRIGDILRERGVPTAVARDAECLSACAVLFLAGLEWFNDGTPPSPQRLLHAGGRLGFHAPSLPVPKGSFTEKDIADAYDLAIASLAEVSARKADWQLADSLLTTLLRTPPTQMYDVDTVFDAALWGIAVVGTVHPETNSFLNAAEACSKAYSHRRETGQAALSEIPIGPEHLHGYEPARVDDIDNGPSIHIGGFGDEGAAETCLVSFYGNNPGEIAPKAQAMRAVNEHGDPNWFAKANWSGGDYNNLLPFMFFPSATPLSAIVTVADGAFAEVDTARFRRPDIDTTTTGRCTVWRGDTLQDEDPCTEARLKTVSPDLVRTDLHRYRWPSGAETVVKIQDWKPTVNGRSANKLWEWDPPPGMAGSCWLNQGSGNTFCFEPG
ncbi:hypothetical protein [Antarctobacter heliothermus]|uniref:hypothetical protein n=1 Tax=Antarctobacter heliothermus TaxID=74033 RepID=UPI001130CB38|nr:hypothetical protein [Antarctobacter heliothermus]